MPTTERRKHPRVSANFPARIEALPACRVKDVSEAGVRCSLDTPVSPMTMVALLLEIPTITESGREYAEVLCQGVVVRCETIEEEDNARYDVAILFQDLEPDSQEIVAGFVRKNL
jgi:hypothetical protein